MKLHLLRKHIELDQVITFVWSAPMQLDWLAGQYAIYKLDHELPDDKGTKRYFTISASPHEKQLQITTRITNSSYKQALNNLPIGGEIELVEIGGNFIFINTDTSVVFVAGGIGITPFRAMLKQQQHDSVPRSITLIYANKDQSILFKDELTSLQQLSDKIVVNYVISPERIDEKYIQSLVKDNVDACYYVSGPEPMVKNTEVLLKQSLISDQKIKRDYFPGYEWPN